MTLDDRDATRASMIERSSYGGAVVRVVSDDDVDGTWLVEAGEPGPAGEESGREAIEIGAGPVAAQVAELLGRWLALDRDWPLVRQPDRDEDGVAAIEPPATRGEVIVLLRRLRWAWSDPSQDEIDAAGLDPAAVERAGVSALCALTPASDRDRRAPDWLDVLADEVTAAADRLTALGRSGTATEHLTPAAALLRQAAVQLRSHEEAESTSEAPREGIRPPVREATDLLPQCRLPGWTCP